MRMKKVKGLMRSNQLFFVVVFSFLYLTMLVLSHIANFIPSFGISESTYAPTVQAQPVTSAAATTTPPPVTPESLNNITPNDFQSKIINPVLVKLNIYSPSTSTLLLGTAIQESLIGKLSKNIFQITLSTAKDINENYLTKHPDLQNAVNTFYTPQQTLAWNLKNNVNYQTALATIVYLKTNKPIPNSNNPEALGKFWKVNYNTYDGKGNARQYADHLEYFLTNNDVPVSELQA